MYIGGDIPGLPPDVVMCGIVWILLLVLVLLKGRNCAIASGLEVLENGLLRHRVVGDARGPPLSATSGTLGSVRYRCS